MLSSVLPFEVFCVFVLFFLQINWFIEYNFFQAFSQHMVLSVLFLEHVISVLSQIPILKGDVERLEDSQVDSHTEDGKLQAAIFALTAFFRSVLSVMLFVFKIHKSSNNFTNHYLMQRWGKSWKKGRWTKLCFCSFWAYTATWKLSWFNLFWSAWTIEVRV